MPALLRVPTGRLEMLRSQILVPAALLLFVSGVFAETKADPTGVWLTQDGDAKIKISQCVTGLCGTIIWLKAPIDPSTGKPQVDDKNANPSLAKRPIIGINIFSEMKAAPGSKWSGKIYNADNGKTYSTELTVAAPRKLEVRGCVLAVLCGSETWTKLEDVKLATTGD